MSAPCMTIVTSLFPYRYTTKSFFVHIRNVIPHLLFCNLKSNMLKVI